MVSHYYCNILYLSLIFRTISGGAIADIVIAIIILLAIVVLVGLIIFYILYKNKGMSCYLYNVMICTCCVQCYRNSRFFSKYNVVIVGIIISIIIILVLIVVILIVVIILIYKGQYYIVVTITTVCVCSTSVQY